MPITYTVDTKNGTRSVESPYNDWEALTQLAQRVLSGHIAGDFAFSLSSHKGDLSPKQTAWVQVLVCEDDERRRSAECPHECDGCQKPIERTGLCSDCESALYSF